MPSKKPMITLRTEPETIAKLKYIADHEHRSDNKELEHILLSYIEEFETKNGAIPIE